MNTLERILQFALPKLQGRTVMNLNLGLSLIAVQLDDGYIGTSMSLSEEIGNCYVIFPLVRDVIGAEAAQIARWAVEREEAVCRAVGIAVLNAAANYQPLPDMVISEASEAVRIMKTDTVGMIGNIHPLYKVMKENAARYYIFDRGVPGDDIIPDDRQPELLPTCDIVLITGSSFANASFDTLLSYCVKAREVWVVGPTTPLYPLAFEGSHVTHLSGSLWKSAAAAEIFRGISLGAAMRDISEHANKVTVKISG